MHERRVGSLVVLASLVAFGALGILLALLLGPVADSATSQNKDRAAAVNSTRQTFLAAAAGTAALLGLAFTGGTYYLARRGQQADRYIKAIPHLASDRLTERLGAIHALEHLMRESPVDHMTVVEILTTFVRETTRDASASKCGASKVPADVQTALSVLGRRPRRTESQKLDFSRANLRGANLTGLWFQGANFSGACLEDADLFSAQMPSATLTGACLQRADLSNANLQWSHMAGVDLRDSVLFAAQLQDAILTRARLHGASLFGGNLRRTNLLQAQLHGANLNSARLEGAALVMAQLEGSRLVGACLRGASLKDAKLHRADLTDADLRQANLTGCLMIGATISNTSFEGAQIEYSQFTEADSTLWPHLREREVSPEDLIGRPRKPSRADARDEKFVAAARKLMRQLIFLIEDLEDAGIWPRVEEDKLLHQLAIKTAEWADELPDSGFAAEWVSALIPLVNEWWPSYPEPVRKLYDKVQEMRRLLTHRSPPPSGVQDFGNFDKGSVGDDHSRDGLRV